MEEIQSVCIPLTIIPDSRYLSIPTIYLPQAYIEPLKSPPGGRADLGRLFAVVGLGGVDEVVAGNIEREQDLLHTDDGLRAGVFEL